jgi:hypothetical protein
MNGLSIEELDKIIKNAQSEINAKLAAIAPPKDVYISCLIDESGSMNAIAKDVIGGFNRFLKEQREASNGLNAYISLYFFSDYYRNIMDNVPIYKALELTDKSYKPSNTTALLDAMGKMLTDILDKNNENNIILVMTDGAENSSKEYSNDIIKELTKRCEDRGYKFVYIGANQDSFREFFKRIF